MGTRPERFDIEHGYHHVMSRGTAQWLIFLDDVDRRRFLWYLGRVSARYGVEVVAFCLMGNHFHLVLYCPRGQLSEALRDLKSAYARSFNRRHGRSGPLYDDRFRSKIVLDDGYFVAVVRYVHRNPLDIDAKLDLGGYAWSSHGCYLGRAPTPPWLHPAVALELFGGTIEQYQRLIETPRATDKVQNRTTSLTETERQGREVHDSRPSLSQILEAVSISAGVDASEVRPRLHNGLVGIAVVLAIDHGGFLAPEIAEPFGFSSANAVRMSAKRARLRLSTKSDSASIEDRARLMLLAAA